MEKDKYATYTIIAFGSSASAQDHKDIRDEVIYSLMINRFITEVNRMIEMLTMNAQMPIMEAIYRE